MSVVAPGQTGSSVEYQYTNNPQECTRKIGDFVIAASSPEAIDEIIHMASIKGIPIDEIRNSDFLRGIGWDNYSLDLCADNNGNTYYLFTVNEKGTDAIKKFNDEEYFGDKIPSFPPGTNVYFNSKFNTSSTGVERQAGLDGLKASAKLIYGEVYKADLQSLANLDNSSINPDTLVLMKRIFGENIVFNQGHLNTLKMMGLVKGKVGDGLSSWILSTNGNTISAAFGDTPPKFIPSINLLNISSSLHMRAAGVAQYFTDTGYKIGTDGKPAFTSKDVENIAEELLKSLSQNTSTATLPAGFQYGDNVQTFLNKLFGLPATNTEFNANHINAAVEMGLLSYDAAANKVTLTSQGQLYLKDKAADPTAPPTTGPSTNPKLSKINELKSALYGLRDNFKKFDAANDGKTDGIVDWNEISLVYAREGENSEAGRAAGILLKYRDALDVLGIGLKDHSRNDNRFTLHELQIFTSGVEAQIAEWANASAAPGADGYPPLNTKNSDAVYNDHRDRWIPYAKRSKNGKIYGQDKGGSDDSSWNLIISNNAAIRGLLTFGDKKYGLGEATGYNKFMDTFRPS